MTITAFPSGVNSYGVPTIGAGGGIPSTTGTYIFVSSTSGSDSNTGLDKAHAVATLAQGITLSTASVGDVIILMPCHAETITTTLTPKAGTTIVGVGFGRNRAVLTAGTGAIDTFTLSANNVTLQNFVLVGAASGVTALLELSGTYPRFINMEIQGAAAPTTLVTVSAGADGAVWQDCRFRAAAGTAVIIAIEATAIAPDWLMTNNYIHGSSVRDIDTAIIQMSKKSLTGLLIDGMYCVGVVGGDNPAGAFDFNSSTSASADGLLANVHIAFDAAITIGEAADLGGMNTSMFWVNDVAGATSGRFPTTTAS